MTPSLENLISIAGKYWPASKDFRSAQEASPGEKLLYERWEHELETNMKRWWSFLDGLERALPGFSIGDATATSDAGFRCVAYPAGPHSLPDLRWLIVGCTSIIAPVYILYGVRFEYTERTRIFRAMDFDLQRPELQASARILAKEIDAKIEKEEKEKAGL